MPALTVTRSATRWNVTFANPPENRVDPEMILELQALVDELDHDTEVTVVVFASDDADHFLGPYDMSRAADTPDTPGPTGLPPWLDLTARLSRLPVVSIARIRGTSRGVGQEFALACDLRFASLERTAIDQPEVRHRLVPGGGAIARLPALAGRARALELILGSAVLDGARLVPAPACHQEQDGHHAQHARKQRVTRAIAVSVRDGHRHQCWTRARADAPAAV